MPRRPDAEPVKITVALGDGVIKTIVRTSVDIKPDMCIWRGTVEQTGRPVTLMWWPNGKMAGTVQEAGPHLLDPPPRRPGLRHGRDEQDRMPHEHAPMPARLRTNDPQPAR